MQQVALVGVVECVGDSRDDLEHISWRHPMGVSVAHQLGSVGAFDVVHGDPELAVVLAPVMDRDDMGMP